MEFFGEMEKMEYNTRNNMNKDIKITDIGVSGIMINGAELDK